MTLFHDKRFHLQLYMLLLFCALFSISFFVSIPLYWVSVALLSGETKKNNNTHKHEKETDKQEENITEIDASHSKRFSTVIAVYVNTAIKHMKFYSDVNSRRFMTVNIRIHLKKTVHIHPDWGSRRHFEADRQWMVIYVT